MSRAFKVPILLPQDPLAALEAATKQYVDAKTQSAVQATFQWNTSTTMADPGAGFMRANNATPAVATQLAVSIYDTAGTARVALLELDVGDRIAFYFESDLNRYAKYIVAGPITNNANTWILIPVTPDTTSGTFTPGNNQRITAIWSASSGGGGGSINEVWIGPTEPTDPNVELWYDTDAVPPPITFG